MSQTFKKGERLCNINQIKVLFENGNTIKAFPFKLIWKLTKEITEFPIQVLIAVPKRNIKKAVLRNKIKRKIREAYRKNKFILLKEPTENQDSLTLVLLFSGKEEISYIETETKIIQLLLRLKNEYAKNN
ncbi:MAG: ribonuclease P protein component [Bacteroidota bacterium]|nr:ribonuclease P protein component [Bacteroidota bacterium]